jgi:sporulation protein YlmC with PRC-barrel domain
MLHRISSLKKYHLAASDGHIGHIKDVYFDSHEWTVRYLAVKTRAWLVGKEVLIPAKALGLINAEDESIRVNLSLEKIKGAPDSETSPPVSRHENVAFHSYYGFSPGVAPWVALHTPTSAGSLISPAMPLAGEALISAGGAADAEGGDVNPRSAHDVTGHTIHCSDEEIGRVGDFLVDDGDWAIRYFIVDTSVWFGNEVVVPTMAIREVSWDRRTVYLSIPRERVKNAPRYDADALRIEAYEQHVAAYYDRGWGAA